MGISFGRYKGTAFSKIPKDYLQWALNNANRASKADREGICKALGIKTDQLKEVKAEHKREVEQLTRKVERLQSEVERWREAAHTFAEIATVDDAPAIDYSASYRKYAKKYHPDRGGTIGQMAVVNEIFDELRKA